MEIDERVMASGVLISRRSPLRVVNFIKGDFAVRVQRLAAGFLLAGRRIAHIFHVATPSLAGRRELVGNGLELGGVDAAGSDRLTVRRDARELEIIIEGAID